MSPRKIQMRMLHQVIYNPQYEIEAVSWNLPLLAGLNVTSIVGLCKCNFDSGFMQGSPYTRSGWIIRESNGHTILCGSAKLHPSTSSLHAEVLGFLHALQVIWIHGLRYVWFETDNRDLVTLLNNDEDHRLLGPLLCDIRYWMLKLPYCSIDFVNRERNSAADTSSLHAGVLLIRMIKPQIWF
ncbi:Polynucleotidyl transferase, ribonuclease H-like superfamily protein [Arabidopsis thaliana]|jgi:ribonuclease HI|uniref:Polynucleotidyl transferase, ribonuclease H-like superfamily protein n=1 Tax=Arabidopsis thaliana TaxID=3702 RepID=Q3E7R1_ARATH|nr:Polynucleotidyl transferase, ribonuclease H-like superfamily protein [Arabidopsis thaliana]AEE82304.1 Polynucleotidyl transferase, ribonuclease H-like superfamily protein [Arabidopsis thaliana]|eukprot:NP_680570.4 Polynucleotidyl transferase, ribonuclease H-like superfamily protein [Arabidopsis thaliana]